MSSTRSTWRKRARSRTTTTHTRSRDELQATVVAQRFGELIGRPDERSVPGGVLRQCCRRGRRGPAESGQWPWIDRELESAAAVLRGSGCRVPGFPVAGSAPSALVDAPRERAVCRADHSVHFLFLREVLAEPWTWTVGALAVAFQPLFGFISSGVHPDALLFTASAALFFTRRARVSQGADTRTRRGDRSRPDRRPVHKAQLRRVDSRGGDRARPPCLACRGQTTRRAARRSHRARRAGGCGGSVRRAERRGLGPALERARHDQ